MLSPAGTDGVSGQVERLVSKVSDNNTFTVGIVTEESRCVLAVLETLARQKLGAI